MSEFFSIVTNPENYAGKHFYFDWEWRKVHLSDENDSHSIICKHFGLQEDVCNKYEFNPLTKIFTVDQINNQVNDQAQVEEWFNTLDYKRIIEPLIIKPIINPLELPLPALVLDEQVELLRQWACVWASVRASVWASVRDSMRASVWDSVRASVWASVWDSVGDSVGASVRASVWASVRASVWASVRASVWASVWDSVGAYVSSFFDTQYKYDFSPCVKLWEMGLVPSFDGKTWRLHSGSKSAIVYLISKVDLEKG
jgi:hypothetical protein